MSGIEVDTIDKIPQYQIDPSVDTDDLSVDLEKINPTSYKEQLELEERKKRKANVENQWSSLMNKYRITMEVCAGCGDRGEGSIDTMFKELNAFADQYPIYKSRIPKRQPNSDDGYAGVSSGMAAFAGRRRGEEPCVIS